MSKPLDVLALLGGLWLGMPAAADGTEPVAFRYQAPVVLTQPGTFVELALPASAYGHSEQADLHDLRLVDARGARVPFALLPPRTPQTRQSEQRRTATLYLLPARSARPDGSAAPLDIRIEGERIHIQRQAASGSAKPLPPTGWLIDLGTWPPHDPAPHTLDLRWTESAEFTAVFDLASSDDLRNWRPAGSGQLMALQSAGAPLLQTQVPLPDGVGRYLQLTWLDASQAPPLTGAQTLTAQQQTEPTDAPTTLQISPSPEPAPPAPTASGHRGKPVATGPVAALHFDLGGTLPLSWIDLQLPPGTWIAPVQWQGRQSIQDAWLPLGAHVHYRLERNGQHSESPPFAVETRMRYLRALPDERAGTLDPQQTRLTVQATLAKLVFVSQGQPPYTLLAGARNAPDSALPVSTLMADLDAERPRFGHAMLEDWHDTTPAADGAEQLAAWRPWLLWAVLLLGVSGLGAMVWRLSRQPADKA